MTSHVEWLDKQQERNEQHKRTLDASKRIVAALDAVSRTTGPDSYYKAQNELQAAIFEAREVIRDG